MSRCEPSIGGPQKDLGEAAGSQKMVAVGHTGSSRLEGAATQAALRQSNEDDGGMGQMKSDIGKIKEAMTGGSGPSSSGAEEQLIDAKQGAEDAGEPPSE